MPEGKEAVSPFAPYPHAGPDSNSHPDANLTILV